jgi:hypothetical protein
MPNSAKACTDPIVGAILSGWRYDISSISPEMRTDYESHLEECFHCRRRQSIARMIDVLLISITSLSIVAFLLVSVVLYRIEMLSRYLPAVHMHLHHSAMTISLEAVSVAGLVVSTVLWILVAVATPVPVFISGVVAQRIPSDLRQRFARRHA